MSDHDDIMKELERLSAQDKRAVNPMNKNNVVIHRKANIINNDNVPNGGWDWNSHKVSYSPKDYDEEFADSISEVSLENIELKSKKSEENIPKISAFDNPAQVKKQVELYSSSGMSADEVHHFLSSIYYDLQELINKGLSDNTPAPFAIGDILANSETRMNHKYFKVTKLYKDMIGNWMADFEHVIGRDGFEECVSSTTMRKQLRRFNKSVGIQLKSDRYKRISPADMPKLFSRHPNTNIFF